MFIRNNTRICDRFKFTCIFDNSIKLIILINKTIISFHFPRKFETIILIYGENK